ncbi:hypothetical protein GCM10010279_02850 [Streptomyces mutabilis]|nr:hypothetical protein GCM10010279_02850 [Streptomyces mutabilis]
MDGRDGQFGFAAPSEGEACVPEEALSGEGVFESAEQLLPGQWPARRAVRGVAMGMLDLQRVPILVELPMSA